VLHVKYLLPLPSNKFKMSSLVSPFVSALPLPHHLLFEYDEDGDAIMTDAVTGERLIYGRERAQSTGTLVASPVAKAPSPVPVCPPAPPRSRAPVGPVEEDGAASPVRNLAEAMAEAVLEGEPREEAAAPPGGEPAPAGVPEPAAEEDWCVSVTVSDLALRLDMRHPRVLLNLLRFVSTYNELAPPGEAIHLPLIPQERADHILSHVSVANPVPEFAEQVAELRALMERYTEYSDDDDGYHSEDSYYSRGY
jgi:hypothetical protein